MKNPLRICENKKLSLNNIKQYYIQLETNDYKFDTLIDLFEILTKTPVIVFCNTKKVVKQLKEMMENKSLAVSSIVIQNQKKSFTKNFC
jgi:superfamily II DNA/RNA helicase